MQISNNTHYASDAYLQSKKQYEIDHKNELKKEAERSDTTIQKIEEKSYNKSINAAQAPQAASEQQNPENNNRHSTNNTAAEKAVTSYNEVENAKSSQAYFNQIRETV